MTLPITVACALFADDVVFVSPGSKMGGCSPYPSLARSNDLYFCDSQSSGMVDVFARKGRAKLED